MAVVAFYPIGVYVTAVLISFHSPKLLFRMGGMGLSIASILIGSAGLLLLLPPYAAAAFGIDRHRLRHRRDKSGKFADAGTAHYGANGRPGDVDQANRGAAGRRDGGRVRANSGVALRLARGCCRARSHRLGLGDCLATHQSIGSMALPEQ